MWSVPLKLGLALYFIWEHLGPSALVGLGVMVLLIPTKYFIFGKLNKLKALQMETKDERLEKMSEILCGMKILKLFGWEESFKNKVKEIRCKEIKTLRYHFYLDALPEVVVQSSPFFVSLATFATYILIDPPNVLTPGKRSCLSLSSTWSRFS